MKFADLDISKPADAHVLYRRIRAAAQVVCSKKSRSLYVVRRGKARALRSFAPRTVFLILGGTQMSYRCPCTFNAQPLWEVWDGDVHIPRHRHAHPYAALIVAGTYEESGTFGRHRVQPGEVLLHRAFDSHLDRFGPKGARILSLPLRATPSYGLGLIVDPDHIIRLAETDPIASAASLKEQLRPKHIRASDWPEILASDLLCDPTLRLHDWAERQGLARETLGRGFRKVFGMTPAAFRAEVRAQTAWRGIADTALPISQIADESGFADQAHMTRAIVQLTELSPGRWRKSNRFKTSVREVL